MEVLRIILLEPILNFLLVLTNVLFGNFGLGVIALTVIFRVILLPLTLMQLRSGKKQSETLNAIKPKLEVLKKKYAKNPQKLNQETMKVYKEAGISPMGCLASPMMLSTIIQIPLYVGVYRAVLQGLAATPQDFLGLSQNIYSWALANQGLPVSGRFLWMDLVAPDPWYVLPVLVGATQWISQKMMTPPTADPQQRTTNNMMQIMMPLVMAFITVQFPAGLGLYFLVGSVLMIGIQYFVYGFGNLFAKAPPPEAETKKDGKSEKAKAATRDAASAKESPAGGLLGPLGDAFTSLKQKLRNRKKGDKPG